MSEMDNEGFRTPPPVKRSGQTSPNAQQTPTPTLVSLEELEDLKAQERYMEIGRKMEGYGSSMDFDVLISKLGLDNDYTMFESSVGQLFHGIAQDAPLLANGVFHRNSKGQHVKATERMLADWFQEVYNNMAQTDFRMIPAANPGWESAYEDHQDHSVPGTGLKPDGVIYFAPEIYSAQSIHIPIEAKLASHTGELPVLVLGQIAEYARVIWAAQHTRTFVPVVLLHGINMTLFVFARNGYYRVEVGKYLHGSATLLPSRITALMSCYQKLWFLLKQEPNKFGHFVDVSKNSRFIRFTGSIQSSTAEVAPRGDSSAAALEKRIPREIHLLGRAAYLVKAKYLGKSVILKLSWTPIDRMPEGAVYDVLEQGKVRWLPEIFLRGTLVKDLLGYRLEYLLMEDCGETIGARIKSLVKRKSPVKKCHNFYKFL
ncbi:hypothetical protein GGF43_002669 [Coemansia sp. RSA 2618]|nr:hypothetical protein GGF43_002669 [Coemansia sp. RSA 2618]